MTFKLPIKLQMELFIAKYDHFFKWSCAYSDPLFDWTSAYVCQKLRTELLCFKLLKYQQINWDTIDLARINQAAKGAFLDKSKDFF